MSILIENVADKKNILFAKQTNATTNKLKIEAWREIAGYVNANGSSNRTVAEIREKWTDLASRTKKKVPKKAAHESDWWGKRRKGVDERRKCDHYNWGSSNWGHLGRN